MESIYTGPRRFAHRGVSQAAPENTLGAFQGAVDLGLEGIELDIHMSKDGEVVVVHDSNLTRLTLGHPTKFTNEIIADATWEELSKVELPYANHLLNDTLPNNSENEFLALMPGRFMGQDWGSPYKTALIEEPRMAKLMRLADFLEWFETTPESLQVEIEVNASDAAKPIMELLEKCSARERCIVFSGHPGYIAEMQMFCAMNGKPEGVKLGANIREINEDILEDIEDMDLYEVGLNAHHIKPDDIKLLDSMGIKILSNLGDYPEWWEEMSSLGIYGFKTNYAKAYTEWWQNSRNK